MTYNNNNFEFCTLKYLPTHNAILLLNNQRNLTLKGPGFFVYLKSGGGGGFRPPPSDLGRGATKNSEIWHVRRVHQYARADKIAMLKIKPFFNYANLC